MLLQASVSEHLRPRRRLKNNRNQAFPLVSTPILRRQQITVYSPLVVRIILHNLQVVDCLDKHHKIRIQVVQASLVRRTPIISNSSLQISLVKLLSLVHRILALACLVRPLRQRQATISLAIIMHKTTLLPVTCSAGALINQHNPHSVTYSGAQLSPILTCLRTLSIRIIRTRNNSPSRSNNNSSSQNLSRRLHSLSMVRHLVNLNSRGRDQHS